ncbi:MAG: hypothetical protein L3J43_09900 [Sulfurovum sp.]|nr:hypothetical protein [Sulfurovum sp.]
MLGKKYMIVFLVCYIFIQAETLGTFEIVTPKLSRIYNDVHYEFNEKMLRKQYTKWEKHNTGSYVYILDGNNTSYQLHELKNNLIFISNNSLELSIGLLDIGNKRDNMKNHYYPLKYTKGKKMRCGTTLVKKELFNKSLALDYRFPIKRHLSKSHLCKKIKLEHQYDAKYGYVNLEEEKCIGASKFNTRVNYAYGLLLLPKNEKYTNNVINKILDKYEKAWVCKEKRKQIKKEQNYSNLSLLEKSVGKEKLECLDKYLVWDENESK